MVRDIDVIPGVFSAAELAEGAGRLALRSSKK